MKWYLFLLSLICLSCNINSKNETAKNKKTIKKDTIPAVTYISIPQELSCNRIEREYFSITNNDTFDYSLITSNDTTNNKISIFYQFNPIKQKAIFNPNDTLAIDTTIKKNIKKNHHCDGDRIHDIQIIFKTLSTDFDLSKLKSIRMMLSTNETLSNNLARQLADVHGNFTNENIQTIIKKNINKSLLISNLNAILLEYRLTICDFEIVELVSIPITENVKSQKKSSLKYKIDGLMIFKISPYFKK